MLKNKLLSAMGGAPANYIEDVFSTWLYTGNGSTQTITNGIDLAGKGGLVWCKALTTGGLYHTLTDTVTGASKALFSNDTSGQLSGNYVTAFGATGFSIGNNGYLNYNTEPTVSWTFRKQPKFFDVVTFSGNGSGSQFVNHNLQSSYGFIVIKRTDSTSDWFVLAKESSADLYWQLKLNSTAAYTGLFGADPNTNTGFFPSSVIGAAAVNGGTYVAYLFAHNAGGFGLTGTDNVISCGSFTCPSSGGVDVNLGYEPQWILTKKVSGAENWNTWDTMRGWALTNQAFLAPNNSNAEVTFSGTEYFYPTATGFRLNSSFGLIGDYIYIAIRRGPMKVPTDGTKVFKPVTRAGTGADAAVTGVGFTPDLIMDRYRAAGADTVAYDRLRGISPYMATNLTTAESGFGGSGNISFDMDGVTLGTGAPFNASGNNYINWFFQRAPNFFDEVCYTGTGVARTVAHNLGVAPELMIVKSRSAAYFWAVYAAPLGNTQGLFLQANSAASTRAEWNNTTPTSSVFSVSTSVFVNESAATYVAYLFATCPGVSKVGSYTGTGTTQQINCGFTGGARFVLIKRTDSTGDWYVWDSARGIVAGNDPYLLLNSTAAEVTNTDYVDTYSAGFEISSTAPAAINASGRTFIFLAIA